MRTSLIAGPLAARLVLALAANGHSSNASHRGNVYTLSLSARQCMRRGVYSGGLVIEASVTAPEYASGNMRIKKRLRAGWTLDSVQRHAADIAEQMRQQRTALITQLRERVYRLSETKVIDADNLPRESSCFDDMPEEECNFWLQWLATQPAKMEVQS